ncbi:UDP-N-acetylmuramate dehydrogenase [Deferribacter autotrophicus]|uniref:UDP-N-acetylenolpyruvoylglucosamine reductase n=1 Tax=Deferribacter autotrophicus TaxID=500465 RepID=A0A5A8F7Y0_9BACT|nr:UDP-N-acetylmuramate dehydrogenase [Deferribacter autotrophicus]KAA0258372.1 UDP-N-acetylmuramate dehydrogenase [Deferribacter autotrophicus]
MIRIIENEPLSKHTTYRVGGPAKYFIMPVTNDELIETISWAKSKKLSYEIIGFGSNVLFMDEGFEGVVVSTALLNRWILDKKEFLVAGCGVGLMELVEFAVHKGIAGFEKLAGIPGSVGGAVKMNAGAFGIEMKDILVDCLVYDIDKNDVEVIKNEDCVFSYRKAKGLENKIILSARFLRKRGEIKELEKIKNDILVRREDKQPLEFASCGSVFKRPTGDYAGRLIEEAGLKGFSIGGAKVSEKHANFIVNCGDAKSKDILAIIDHVQSTVYKKFGILLEPEVKIIK